MRQSVSMDKYSIAWFKLAEYVSRGEKERALGIYKLLSHSIEDQAFARQLEGDILWSFNDSGAAERYHEAAQLYKKDQRVLQAAALYEHLVALHPDSILYLTHLVDLYSSLQIKSKIIGHGKHLFQQLIRAGELESASDLITKCEAYVVDAVGWHETLFFALLKKPSASEEICCFHLQKVLDGLSNDALDNFLTHVKAKSERYYQWACAYVGDK